MNIQTDSAASLVSLVSDAGYVKLIEAFQHAATDINNNVPSLQGHMSDNQINRVGAISRAFNAAAAMLSAEFEVSQIGDEDPNVR